ncbi:DUF2929 family protein [Ornithinibacillus gellani]|uniref:DUF2929 family protein n=1 Tax=Ornithinibacillus gellani TaxID=2293253 RepID=UPI000F46D7C3|nr:DUF2929 family protein [Ornithinibacillus gellani]TQS75819.1 DUF2929 family protein [Ornithinibacillus gellani]
MRYIITALWAVLISSVLSYVLTSMGNQAFNLNDTLVLAGVFSIIIFILGDGILKGEKSHS